MFITEKTEFIFALILAPHPTTPPLGNILIIFLRNQIQRMKSLNLKIIIFNFVDPRIFFVRLFTFSSARSV